VAAKVIKSNEDGCWILGNVLDYNPVSQLYRIQDEDDSNRIVTLSFHEVKRLEDTAQHLKKGDPVLAVFPETTSFYRAIVAKNPRPPIMSNGQGYGYGDTYNGWEVIVRFEDDEDSTGEKALLLGNIDLCR
jgi:hypothetical protein